MLWLQWRQDWSIFTSFCILFFQWNSIIWALWRQLCCSYLWFLNGFAEGHWFIRFQTFCKQSRDSQFLKYSIFQMVFKQINLGIEIPLLSLCCCGEFNEFDVKLLPNRVLRLVAGFCESCFFWRVTGLLAQFFSGLGFFLFFRYIRILFLVLSAFWVFLEG